MPTHTLSIKEKKVGLVGLGHVGLTLGLTLADVGFTVCGIDKNIKVTEALKSGKAHFSEKGVDDLLREHLGKTFTIVDDFSKENQCDIYIVTVGTPLDGKLNPDYSFIQSAADELGKVMKKGDLVILRSTVPLGTSRKHVLSRIQNVSGLSEKDIHIAFAPERTIEGNALHELRALPQIVGGLDTVSTELAAALFRTMTEEVIALPTLEEAEIVKLINNSYREVVFSFANEVSLVAREWGIDTKRVITAANSGYARSNIPLPSPGVGGYCLTKDGYLLSTSAKEKKIPLHIIPMTRQVSSEMLHSVANDIHSFLKNKTLKNKPAKVAILGFAFKGNPATSDMRGSMTLVLIKRLQTLGTSSILTGYDPLVSEAHMKSTGVIVAPTMEKAVEDADIIVIMNNHEEFKDLAPILTSVKREHPLLLHDTWGLIDQKDLDDTPHITYKTL